MKMSHNKAIATFRAGDADKAWAIAQQDEGLLPGVTREAWVAFAEKCVANEDAAQKAYDANF